MHLSQVLHCTVLNGKAFPVQLLTCLGTLPPALGRPARLQGVLVRGCVPSSPSPAQKHTAATVTAQHQLYTGHLTEQVQKQGVNISHSLTRTQIALDSPLSSCQHLWFSPQSWNCSIWFSLATGSYTLDLTTPPYTTGCIPTNTRTTQTHSVMFYEKTKLYFLWHRWSLELSWTNWRTGFDPQTISYQVHFFHQVVYYPPTSLMRPVKSRLFAPCESKL